VDGSISLVDSIRSFALPPTMRMHMRRATNKTEAIEPIIQSMYVPSLVWKFTHLLFCKKYSKPFESGNALIFLAFYDLLASMN
jgi:hypothetical protein